MGIGMLIGAILFWTLVIAGLVLLVRWLIRRNRQPQDTALDVLKRRYAEGQISREQFEQMRQDIEERDRRPA